MRLIDADRLKEEIVEAGQESTRYRIGEFWELNRNEIWKVIDEQPTVEERKKGRWIVWGGMDIPENHGRHKCSLCGGFAPVRYEKPLIKENLSNFCPNCGADMRKENES